MYIHWSECRLGTLKYLRSYSNRLALSHLSSDGALDQTVRISLWRIDFGVLAGILETVMPA